jgi:poly(A) polymerase
MSYKATQSRASSVRPLLVGDEVHGRPIRGFAWKAPDPGRRSDHTDDRLLLDGDESLPAPPDRRVPQSSEGAAAIAPMPPSDLSRPGQVIGAADLDPVLSGRIDALLDLHSAGWQPLIRPLVAAVHATGHRLWLAGGAVRDAVCNLPPEQTNDLDMSGTVQAGRFVDITYQVLRATGKTEYPIFVCPDDLVCSVKLTDDRTIIEYRGLSVGGFQFPAVGSSLAEDARHRDFSFNSLVYDVMDHEIFDPSGHGLPDLLGDVRRFHPLKETDDPVQLAFVVLRAMKFALRWSGAADLDFEPLHRWLASLPGDLWASLGADDWAYLRQERANIDATAMRQRDFAAGLPEPGRQLLLTLLGGA